MRLMEHLMPIEDVFLYQVEVLLSRAGLSVVVKVGEIEIVGILRIQ